MRCQRGESMWLLVVMLLAAGQLEAEKAKRWEFGTITDVREVTQQVGTVASVDSTSETQTYGQNGQFGRTKTNSQAVSKDVTEIHQAVIVRTKTMNIVAVKVIKFVWQHRADVTVGGGVMARIEGRYLYLRDAEQYIRNEGKDLKLEIVRKELIR